MTRHVVASKKQDWATPRWLFDALNAELHFTVDLAASWYNAKLPRYFDEKHNTLTAGPLAAPERGWGNPPYENIEDWFRWALWSCSYGGFSTWLVPANPDTGWFHKYAALGQIDFFDGRIPFENATPPGVELPRLLAVARARPSVKNHRKLAACAYLVMQAHPPAEYETDPCFIEVAYTLSEKLGSAWRFDGEEEASKKLPGPGFPSMLVVFDPEAPAGKKPFRTRCHKTGVLL